MNAPNPFGWFKKNIPILAQFLDDQLKSPDVKELVILGDLFDTWIIPTTYLPIKSFDRIIANKENKPVIDKLIALAASKDIKLAYVPGNHDMSMRISWRQIFPVFVFSAIMMCRWEASMLGPWWPNTEIATVFLMARICGQIPIVFFPLATLFPG
jgi:hypothetical protein